MFHFHAKKNYKKRNYNKKNYNNKPNKVNTCLNYLTTITTFKETVFQFIKNILKRFYRVGQFALTSYNWGEGDYKWLKQSNYYIYNGYNNRMESLIHLIL